MTEPAASSYIIVLGPQCRNCGVASVTNVLCYVRQLSAPAMPAVHPSCHAAAAAQRHGPPRGRPIITERAACHGGGREGENFHFSQSECGQRARADGRTDRGTWLQPEPGPLALGKEREGKMQAAVGKLLEQVAWACAPTQILIALGLKQWQSFVSIRRCSYKMYILQNIKVYTHLYHLG